MKFVEIFVEKQKKEKMLGNEQRMCLNLAAQISARFVYRRNLSKVFSCYVRRLVLW